METRLVPDLTRRPGTEALSIILADGQSWGLALPSPRLRPEVIEGVDDLGRPSKTIQLVSELNHPLEIRRLIEELRTACDGGEPERQYTALIRLAAALLCRAHDIELSEAVSLLELGLDELPSFVDAVLSVVSGEGLPEPRASRKDKIDG